MNTISLEVDTREVGAKPAKAARKAGLVPCVMYGGEEVKHFNVVSKSLKDLIYTPDFKVVELVLDGKSFRAILKSVQYHPVTDAVVHVDFIELVANKPITVDLPVKFVGSSPGVKNGGKLQQSLRRIKVKTTPENLVDCLVLDISTLKLGHAIRVRDIEVIEGLEVMSPEGTPVASVVVPRALRSAEAGEEEEGEGTEAVAEATEESAE